MGDRPVVVTDENTTVVLPTPLAPRDHEAIAQAGPELLRVVSAGERSTLEVGPVCGVLELEGCRLQVEPKLLVDGVTTAVWIAYASSVPVYVERSRRWSVGAPGLRDIVVEALLHECSRLVANGLLRDYRGEEAEDTVLRGRLNVSRQIGRRYGQVDRLHIHRVDRRTDISENLICRAALDVASSVSVGERRRRIRDIRDAFPPASRGDALARLRRLRYHSLNARYRSALQWAGLLLGDGGVDDMVVPGRWRAGSLLINMNRLWERGVARACADASRELGASAPHHRSIMVAETGRATRSFVPDAVLQGPEPRPVDAKYKRYVGRAISSGDVHQLLTYGTAYESVAILVHPALEPAPPRRLDVRSDGRLLGVIAVVPVDVTRPPEEAAGLLAHL